MEDPKGFEERMKNMLEKAQPGLNIYVCKTSQWIMLNNLLMGADLASGYYYEGINPKNADCTCWKREIKNTVDKNRYKIITRLFPSTKAMVEQLRGLSNRDGAPKLEVEEK